MDHLTEGFIAMQHQLLQKIGNNNNNSSGQVNVDQLAGPSGQSVNVIPAVPDSDNDSVSASGADSIDLEGDTEHFESATQFEDMKKPLTLVEVIEKLYARLPDLTPPPRESLDEGARAKEPLELQGRVKSLPAAPVVLASFRKFLSQYKKQDGKRTTLVDEVTGISHAKKKK